MVGTGRWAVCLTSLCWILSCLWMMNDYALAQEPSPPTTVSTPEVAESAVAKSTVAQKPAHGGGSTHDRRHTLIASVTIFVLAVFLGFELINKVPPTLHTPLMSGSNAISGITVVGALIAAGISTNHIMVSFFGAVAVALAMINVVGGFMVTNRMLLMFRSGPKKADSGR